MENVTLQSFCEGSAGGLPSVGPRSESDPASTSEGDDSAPTGSESDEYGTPAWIIRRITAHGLFDLDPAAGAEPIPIADQCFTKDQDGLAQRWATEPIESIFLNPPYSNPAPFLRKLKHAVDPDCPTAATYALALLKADTSTDYFHDHLAEAKVLCFPDERLQYYGGKTGAGFPSVLAVFGEPPEELLETLSDLGQFYSRVELNAALEQQCLDDIVADGGMTATAIPVTGTSPGSGPASAQEQYTSLDFVTPRDEIVLTFDTESLATRGQNHPEKVTLRVLPGGKDIDPESGSIWIDAVGTTVDGNGVCARVRNSATIASNLEVSLAVGKGRWELVTPKTVSVNT
jgi:phage N-6-adenine-methyltransferase